MWADVDGDKGGKVFDAAISEVEGALFVIAHCVTKAVAQPTIGTSWTAQWDRHGRSVDDTWKAIGQMIASQVVCCKSRRRLVASAIAAIPKT